MDVKFADMILEPLNPALLLGNALATFLFMATDQFREVVSQSFILFVAHVREGGADDSDDGWGEGSRM